MALTVVTDLSTLSPGDYVYGFTDLSGHSRLFDASVALPTVTAAVTVVTYPAGSSPGATTSGPSTLRLTMNAGAKDYGSPSRFVLDQRAVVIKASTSTG